jgi:hypothetical protein
MDASGFLLIRLSKLKQGGAAVDREFSGFSAQWQRAASDGIDWNETTNQGHPSPNRWPCLLFRAQRRCERASHALQRASAEMPRRGLLQ